MPSTRTIHFLGLDLGGTNIKAAIVASNGTGAEPRTIASATGPTEADRGPSHVAGRLVAVGKGLLDENGVQVDSVGVGVPGLFDHETGDIVFFTNLPGEWEGFPLRRHIADGFGVPATLINDARAFALAEAHVGAGRGYANLLCITLGTGVGGGLILDGKLHFGAYGVAGEVGHQTVDPNGPTCGCGNPGCLEALARPPAIAETAGRNSLEEVLDGVAEGDARCTEALTSAIDHLATGVANVLTVFGPERVIIGGGGAEAGEALLDPLRAAVKRRLTLIPPEVVSIVAAELGTTAGAVGAALASQGGLVGDASYLVGEVPSALKRRGSG